MSYSWLSFPYTDGRVCETDLHLLSLILLDLLMFVFTNQIRNCSWLHNVRARSDNNRPENLLLEITFQQEITVLVAKIIST